MSADNAHGSDTGTMDMKDHIKTWKGFVSLIKWMIIGNIVLLTFLAIFRTHG
jgi:hypothetical protein